MWCFLDYATQKALPLSDGLEVTVVSSLLMVPALSRLRSSQCLEGAVDGAWRSGTMVGVTRASLQGKKKTNRREVCAKLEGASIHVGCATKSCGTEDANSWPFSVPVEEGITKLL